MVFMNKKPILLPYPRQLIYTEGFINLSNKKLILFDCDQPHLLLSSANRIQNALLTRLGLKYGISASPAVPKELVGITLRIAPVHMGNPQGNLIHITPTSICIEARDEQGLFYGSCTLIQLIQYFSAFHDKYKNLPAKSIPCMDIVDWPDFLNRGIMLDVSRDKVPKMETIFSLVDLLATWKINQLQLYTEHTFAYQQHPEVWTDASPFTGEEILKLDAYCCERFIELVPNQNSFGHLEHWLKHPRYKSLAEAPDGFDFPWGHFASPFSLCPLDPASIKLVASLYDELLPHFSSRQVNVGCDETFDLGQGRSKEACALSGPGHVYLDFLLKIYSEVTKRGFRMQFWGDIIMAHPELAKELPKDCIALEWGYEANHPFDAHGEIFAQAGLPFYVCPGTSSWNSIAGRTDNCIQNLSNAAKNGLKRGAEGYLITDWGDNGHWQVLLVSYLGFAAGAAYSWSFQANQALDIKAALDQYAFQDASSNLGKVAYDLGNIYQDIGFEPENSSAFFEILQKPIQEWKEYLAPEIALQMLNHTQEFIDQVAVNLSHVTSNRLDNKILEREFNLTLNLLRHACMRGLYGVGSTTYSRSFLSLDLKKIISEYEDIWLIRNRLGGLKESLAYFEIPLKDYE
jgi:hexosaminidase